MASKLTASDLLELITSGIDKRLGIASASDESGSSVLASIVTACEKAEIASADVGPDGRLSVATSLPAVSDAASSSSVELRKSLLSLLTFVTGEEVSTSDLKDWSFVEDALDGLYATIDESLEADAGTDRRVSITPSPSASLTPVSDDRPQSAWADLVDNTRTHFVPILKEKPNAIVPLDPSMIRAQTDKSIQVDFGNVYEREIMHTLGEHRHSDLQFREIVHYEDLESTDLIVVDTSEKLDEMIQDILDHHREVAIDLEHHDIHSFRGFTCLIQISTRDRDYIVDPFPLFHELGRLNKFTTDPKIFKVLHGADMDIQWLQRDFGVYIVNMFDTGQAARVLGLAGGFGLANLLDTFCKVSTNKKFQTSDWRVRPLPNDMLRYARIDTHYLLFIFDKLWNALLALGGGGSAGTASAYGKKMLIQVLEKSAGIASKVWKESTCDFDSEAVQLCLKSSALRVGSIRQNPRAMAVLAALLKWRDSTARSLDESRHYVLSNAAVLRLASAQPPSAAQILRHLSFEKGNSFMPAMKITTQMADEIMGQISAKLETVSSTESVAHKITTNLVPEEPVTKRRNSSVVSVGRESFGRIESRPTRRLSEPARLVSQPCTDSISGLFEIFASKHGESVSNSSKRDQVMNAIAKYLSAVPESVKADLDAWIAAANRVETLGENEDDSGDIVMVNEPLKSEFVPFQKSQKRTIDWEKGELPMTVLEERKAEMGNEKSTAKRASKKMKNSSTTAAQSGRNAAIKALEFIESELSLGKHNNRS